MKIIKSEEMNKHKITKVIHREYAEQLYKGNFYRPKGRNIANKPNGFWLSINEGWENWCKSDMPDWINDSVIIEMRVNPNHNVMVIDTKEDILDVWKEYIDETGFNSMYPSGTNLTCFYSNDNKESDFWDWLIEKYKLDAIYLTEEGQWRTRMETFLYGWDCESMVIFNNEMLKVNRLENKNER